MQAAARHKPSHVDHPTASDNHEHRSGGENTSVADDALQEQVVQCMSSADIELECSTCSFDNALQKLSEYVWEPGRVCAHMPR